MPLPLFNRHIFNRKTKKKSKHLIGFKGRTGRMARFLVEYNGKDDTLDVRPARHIKTGNITGQGRKYVPRFIVVVHAEVLAYEKHNTLRYKQDFKRKVKAVNENSYDYFLTEELDVDGQLIYYGLKLENDTTFASNQHKVKKLFDKLKPADQKEFFKGLVYIHSEKYLTNIKLSDTTNLNLGGATKKIVFLLNWTLIDGLYGSSVEYEKIMPFHYATKEDLKGETSKSAIKKKLELLFKRENLGYLVSTKTVKQKYNRVYPFLEQSNGTMIKKLDGSPMEYHNRLIYGLQREHQHEFRGRIRNLIKQGKYGEAKIKAAQQQRDARNNATTQSRQAASNAGRFATEAATAAATAIREAEVRRAQAELYVSKTKNNMNSIIRNSRQSAQNGQLSARHQKYHMKRIEAKLKTNKAQAMYAPSSEKNQRIINLEQQLTTAKKAAAATLKTSKENPKNAKQAAKQQQQPQQQQQQQQQQQWQQQQQQQMAASKEGEFNHLKIAAAARSSETVNGEAASGDSAVRALSTSAESSNRNVRGFNSFRAVTTDEFGELVEFSSLIIIKANGRIDNAGISALSGPLIGFFRGMFHNTKDFRLISVNELQKEIPFGNIIAGNIKKVYRKAIENPAKYVIIEVKNKKFNNVHLNTNDKQVFVIIPTLKTAKQAAAAAGAGAGAGSTHGGGNPTYRVTRNMFVFTNSEKVRQDLRAEIGYFPQGPKYNNKHIYEDQTSNNKVYVVITNDDIPRSFALLRYYLTMAFENIKTQTKGGSKKINYKQVAGGLKEVYKNNPTAAKAKTRKMIKLLKNMQS